ncbi:DUF4219 domain-containing protein [Tanacetum coccineum]
MSKVLQERGIGGLPGSTEPNPRDHVNRSQPLKLIHLRYTVWDVTHTPYRPHNTEAYFLRQFSSQGDYKTTAVMIGERRKMLTIELADRTLKQPRGIAENMLVRIGEIIFPINFVILDIPEDDDVPLFLGRPLLSTAHSKIDVYKRKTTLRVGEEKLVFKSIKPATSIIRRVFMLKSLDSKIKLVGEDNESFDTLYGNYIKLKHLDIPLEPKINQDVDFEPTIVNESDNVLSSLKMKMLLEKLCSACHFHEIHIMPNGYEEIRSRRQVRANDERMKVEGKKVELND